MLCIKINGQEYLMRHKWHEITLSKACELHDVAMAFPANLREYYKAFIQREGETPEQVQERCNLINETFTVEDHMKLFPVHFGKAIALLADIPEEIMEKVLPGDRILLYQQHVFPLVFAMLYNMPDYSIQEIKSFEHNGVTYMLPVTREILGQKQPMADEPAITFTESADLLISATEMEKGKWERAANIVSILCRPEGEEYDEQTSLARAKEFMELPMSVIFEVFFCVTAPLTIAAQREVIYSMRGALGRSRKRGYAN
jgi:hypothetical protein